MAKIFTNELTSDVNIIIFFLAFFFTSACTPPNNSEKFLPYEHYKELIDQIKKEDFNQAAKKMSRLNQILFSKSDDELIYNERNTYLKSIDSIINSEYGHFYKTEGDRICLTLYGVDENDKPTSLDLELIAEDGNWKFNRIKATYFRSGENYPTSTNCPVSP